MRLSRLSASATATRVLSEGGLHHHYDVEPREQLWRPKRRTVSTWGAVPFYNCIARMQLRPHA